MRRSIATIIMTAMIMCLCMGATAFADQDVPTGVEDGVLTVGMECAYAPYNWTQMDDSNGAVPIVNNPGTSPTATTL